MPRKPKENAVSAAEKKRGKPQKYGSGKCFPLSISVPEAVISRLDGYAESRRVSRSAAAVGLIAAGLEKDGP